MLDGISLDQLRTFIGACARGRKSDGCFQSAKRRSDGLERELSVVVDVRPDVRA
jgi:hypothetical protein